MRPLACRGVRASALQGTGSCLQWVNLWHSRNEVKFQSRKGCATQNERLSAFPLCIICCALQRFLPTLWLQRHFTTVHRQGPDADQRFGVAQLGGASVEQLHPVRAAGQDRITTMAS